MAGHSKWANIKHRKAAQDAKRGQLFTKLIREITVAARNGGAPEDNPRLRTAIDKALGSNMTRDVIDRAIARGAGDNDAKNLEEIVYEGYGPLGTAIYIETMTDNRNRTVSEVRHAFTKRGFALGTSGSVAYQFRVAGVVYVALDDADEERLMESALDAGAIDIRQDGDVWLIESESVPSLEAVKKALESQGIPILEAEMTRLSENYIEILDDKDRERFEKLIDALEELDDVQNVYHNGKI